MYNVSDAYKSAIKKPAIRTRVVGTIAGVHFDDANILAGSLTITNQNSGNENVQIGTVYIGELSVTLRDLSLERYTLNGAEIIPYFELLLEDGETWESVPLGRYYVGEANHTAAGTVIKAYDVMSKFDKACADASVAGTPYQLATLACAACFLTLATDQASFSGFANGSETLTLWQEGTDIETWRDFISWVAQSCGCYVTANRFGKIEFRPYVQDVVDVVDPTGRFSGASYSDYETRYTGLYCTNIEDSTMDYYNLLPDDGLTYSLGQNPFLQYGTAEGKEALRRAILNKLALICYVPFSVALAENPAYDLGDVLSFPDGRGDGEKLFCINKYTWTYHKDIKLEGVGENPALASAQSKTDKNISGLLSKMNDDRFHYYDILNAAEYVIHNGETAEIINLRFVTTKDTHCDFHAELRALIETLEELDDDEDLYTEHDVTGTVTYYLNDELIAYYPIFTEFDGIQLRHLLYFWQASANVIGYFRVTLTARGGTITIPTGHLHAYVAGEGLVGEELDTDPKITDEVLPLIFDMFGEFTDEVETSKPASETGGFAESLAALSFGAVLSAFTDSAETLSGITINTYLSGDYIRDLSVPISGLYWVATANDQYLETVDFIGVTGFVSTSGGMLSYQCSFDNGVTWKGWNGSEWETDLTMTYATIHALTDAEFGSDPVRFKIIFDAGESISGFTIVGGQ